MVGLQKRHDDHDARVAQAWLIEVMRRQDPNKRLPNLETFVDRRHETRQTHAEIKTVFQTISTLYNIPIVTRKRRKPRG